MRLLLVVLVVALLLLGSELWWRKRAVHDEFNRKFIHITVGSFVAFWPFFLSWNEIKLLSLTFLIAVGISKYLNIFRAIHSVQRPTWGELLFALAVGLIAFTTHDKLVYMTALLEMSLADGMAAVIGVHFGKRSRYYVFNQAKSVVGTVTFFIIAAVILVAYRAVSDADITALYLLILAAASSLIENVAVVGLDNLFVPLLVALALIHH
jgi:phytol kinase